MEERKDGTPDALARNSCRVNGGGITMGLRQSSGGSAGSGIEASMACRALIISSGSIDFGAA